MKELDKNNELNVLVHAVTTDPFWQKKLEARYSPTDFANTFNGKAKWYVCSLFEAMQTWHNEHKKTTYIDFGVSYEEFNRFFDSPEYGCILTEMEDELRAVYADFRNRLNLQASKLMEHKSKTAYEGIRRLMNDVQNVLNEEVTV